MKNRRTAKVMICFLLVSGMISLFNVNPALAYQRLSATSNFATTLDQVRSADPRLTCTGSGETKGHHPGWSSPTAVQLTTVTLGVGSYGLYWCPAAAPNGEGVISYTITASVDGITCETVNTYCAMSGITENTPMSVMATDQTGSHLNNGKAIQNSGVVNACDQTNELCKPRLAYETETYFGKNSTNQVMDCTFAAVANWEKIALGLKPDPAKISNEFVNTGGQKYGLTNAQALDYWSSKGIGGTFLKSANILPTDPVTLKNEFTALDVKAVIVQLRFSSGQNFAGNTMPEASYHWVVVDGITPVGPIVVTWGKSLQMTWQQWNVEAVTMWNIAIWT